MCLTISDYFHNEMDEFGNLKPLTHEKGILVYKGLRIRTNELHGKVQDVSYNLCWSVSPSHDYETPCMKIPVTFIDNMFTMETDKLAQYHSYLACMDTIEVGIHSSRDFSGACSYGICFPAVIPAGTEFFVGISNDIVSKKLIIFETRDELDKYRLKHEVESAEDMFKSYMGAF